MYDIKVSAPGKLFLSGEYAVLEGSKAVIDSVGRRVYATPTRKNIPQSILLKKVKDSVSDTLSQRMGSDVGQLPNIDIDSTGFSIDKLKLGIGSSAAVAAAATGALFEWAGIPISENRAELLQVATQAHKSYQNGKGSGADVATSVFGGTIIFSASTPIATAPQNKLKKVFIWTGKSASTVSLVGEIKRLQQNQPHLYNCVMTKLVALAEELAHYYEIGNGQQIISLTADYAIAMDALGEAAGIDIVTQQMKEISSLAKTCKGAAKPSGAGGGDACVALFSTSADANQFISLLEQRHIEILTFATGVPGVCKEHP